MADNPQHALSQQYSASTDRSLLSLDELEQSELQVAHARIITALESMTDAYVSFDLDWRLTYANQAAMQVITQLTALAPSEIADKTHWELFPTVVGTELERLYRESLISQTPAHFEHLYELTGNWFEIHAYPSPIGLSIYFRDITDRKVAENQLRLTEARLRDLLSSNPAVIYACQASGDFAATFISENVQAMLGYESTDFLADSHFWASHIHPEDSPQVFAGLAHLFEHGAHTHEYRFQHRNGQYRWMQDQLKLLRDEAGNPVEIVGYWIDITEKKQLEAQFLRAQRLESLGTLASGIAHDLNNVFTPIVGIVQLLPMKISNLDPSTQKLLQILSDSTRRGADLVKQILSFTRGIEGKPTTTQIKHLIAEIQKVIQQTFPKNIDLLLDLPKDLWLIAADATLLHQVLLNLCVNARDAMPQGGMLTITGENLTIDENYARMNLKAEVGNYVVVTIADTGTGIPPEILDRIFEPFFTTKDIGQGTGLGLSTVIGIINSHHGFVNVYSEVGKGTRFKVYLPATDTTATEPPIVEPEARLGQGELILVVDDETSIQEITKATLEAHGYRAITANDGIEAIALYAEHKQEIRLVLLDMMMPSLDAATTIRTLGKLDPQVQIIAMSGLATNESVTRTMGDKVQAFLAKPFTAGELLNLLDRVMVRR
jgi:PAS domain S-box-containing protein